MGGGGGAAAADTIHELLRTHGLPGGLLPRGVESYSLDEANGLLEARLSAPCYAKYDDGDLAFFDTVVRGNLSFGALRGVEGLSQEELFVWLPVKGIVVADPGSGVILFDIGYAHKRLSRSLFEEPPDCKPSASAGTDAADAARWKDRQGEIAAIHSFIHSPISSFLLEMPSDLFEWFLDLLGSSPLRLSSLSPLWLVGRLVVSPSSLAFVSTSNRWNSNKIPSLGEGGFDRIRPSQSLA